MKYLFAVVCIIWGSFAAASDLPKLYAVTGVKSNDVLNIRAEPRAKAELLGTLAFNASNIEVVAISDDGKWGQINVDERAGWTAIRYLTPSSDTAPFFASCFGTEPFWGLILDETGVASEWSSPESSAPVRDLSEKINFSNSQTAGTFGYVGNAGGDRIFLAKITPKICSDGMSDNLYGLAVDLTITGSNSQSLQGCCTLQR